VNSIVKIFNRFTNQIKYFLPHFIAYILIIQIIDHKKEITTQVFPTFEY